MNAEQLGRIIARGVQTALAEQLKALEARVRELEARPVVRDGGVWEPGRTYEPGMICSHGGAGWLCRSAHVSAGHAPDPSAFRMFMKSHK
jgi:hypothetical protein